MTSLTAKLTLFIFLFCLSPAVFAALAESTWIESFEGEKSIRFARYDGETWTVDDEAIYRSDNPLTSLALGTDLSGVKTLIWTEQIRSKMVLMQMRAILNADGLLSWSPAGLFSDFGRENFSASIVYDLGGQGWVFWSASTHSYSDVVVSRNIGGTWSEPELVHEPNETPDSLPVSSMSETGDVIVEWQAFDQSSNSYHTKIKKFSINADLELRQQSELVDSLGLNDVSLPSDASTEIQAVLHFPKNQMLQSVVIRDNY